MKYSVLFSQASYESTSGSVSAETVVKILYPVAIPKSVESWQSAAVDYEKEHPETKIEFDYLENEEFKAKLPTLLESNDPPSVFFSRGGGVALEQIQAGLWQHITSAIAGGFRDSFYAAGVRPFMSQGKSYGLPGSVGPIVLWYNKELCEKLSVDPSRIRYGEDLLDAVKKCKARGITPMVVGGSENWPLQFFPKGLQ
jgi:raffinose/stachyose/melibiose transport system substrate-binding protein